MSENQNPIVTVNEGKVRGVKQKSTFSDVDYYSFFGIPYGQSTAGAARFKDPVKVEPWNNVLDGTTEKSGCTQFALLYSLSIIGSEDCLYNNIHTSVIPDNNDPLKPVIVNIHPGGHYHGSPETFYYGSPDYVMHHDIVYVCIAYRLHVLGFLNLDLKECSGNQALKDIILGLQWIRDNIKFFGGDPDNVTLLGSSSGASTVHGLMLSPAAKGLFHKVVLMGVYNFNPHGLFNGQNKKEAIRLASSAGFQKSDANNNEKLLAFCKKLPAQLFVDIRFLEDENIAPIFPLSPFTLSADQHSENAIFPKPLDQLIDSTARVPLMFGICEQEAALAFMKDKVEKTMKNFYSSYRQNCWGWGRHITDEQVEEIKQQIDSFYLKGGPIKAASLSQKVDIQTDITYSDVYRTLIDIISADLPSSVFVYKFQFEGNLHTIKDLIQDQLEERVSGTFHGADFSYWCRINDPRPDMLQSRRRSASTPKTKRMVETFTKLITTFARTGDPNYQGLNVEWKPSTPEKPCYLNIDKNLTLIDGKLNGERMEFWEGIIDKYKKQ